MPPSPESRHTCGRGAIRTRQAVPGAILCLAIFLAGLAHPSPASAQRVRVTNLSDVDFGTISNLQAENRRSQSVCLFSNSTGNAYSVSASGSGAGATFALANGTSSLAYDVEWSDRSSQTSGTRLAPNTVLTGQTSSATHQFCNSGPVTSASLTIVLRAVDLSRAQEGSYSGSLTLLITAE